MKIEYKIGWSILIICFLFVSSILLHLYFSEKYVVRYELGHSQSTSGLVINVDTKNAHDGKIYLVGVSYQEAVEMIDSLNAGLKKYPRVE